ARHAARRRDRLPVLRLDTKPKPAGFLTWPALPVYSRGEVERGRMTALVQAALTVRRGARGAFGYFAAFGLALLVTLGLFGRREALGLEHAVVFAAWAV